MFRSLLLASQSPYRRKLLERLQIPFRASRPQINEEQIKKELLIKNLAPKAIAESLALEKAKSLIPTAKDDELILGCDQLIHLDGEILGKSHNREGAFIQLKKLCGKTHELINSCVLVSRYLAQPIVWSDHALLTMGSWSESELFDYIDCDQPFDSAGSYKLELHGIKLFQEIECSDWTAIEGIGLLRLHQEWLKLKINK